jgi:hypothetical protein
MKTIVLREEDWSKIQEMFQKIQNKENWGYFDDSGCAKGYGYYEESWVAESHPIEIAKEALAIKPVEEPEEDWFHECCKHGVMISLSGKEKQCHDCGFIKPLRDEMRVMDRQERISILAESLDERINWLVKEYDVTLTEMLGVMEILKYNMMKEGFEEDEK